jgi:hypothetical protein
MTEEAVVRGLEKFHALKEGSTLRTGHLSELKYTPGRLTLSFQKLGSVALTEMLYRRTARIPPGYRTTEGFIVV